MTIEGILHEKFDTQNIKETFKKREFVVEYAENPQYPEFLKFELIQNNCELLDGYQVGDRIKIDFNLRGRKWTDPKGEVKYFNTLLAWRLNSINDSTSEIAPPPNTEFENDSSQEDDLPF